MLRDGRSRVRASLGVRDFLFSTTFKPTPGLNQSLINRYWIFCRGVKGPEPEVNHSSPPSAQVKNDWSHTYTPLCVFMAWREYFTFFIWQQLFWYSQFVNLPRIKIFRHIRYIQSTATVVFRTDSHK